MNGGSYKHNEDGSVDISLIKFRPDKVGNALRRLFYVALTAAVAMIGNQSRSIPDIIQQALTPQSVAGYLRDPEVKAAFTEILRDVLAAPVEEPEPKTKPTTTKPKPRKPPEPQRLNRLHDGDLIATPVIPLPVIAFSTIPIPAMRVPE